MLNLMPILMQMPTLMLVLMLMLMPILMMSSLTAMMMVSIEHQVVAVTRNSSTAHIPCAQALCTAWTKGQQVNAGKNVTNSVADEAVS